MTVHRFRLLFLILLISTLGWLAPVSKGQQPGGTTQVIGVVKDPLGNLYTNSQVSFIFYDPGTSGKLPLLNGSTFQQTFTGYATDSFGNIPSGIYLPDNGVIASSSGATGTQWIIKVCFSDRVTCFTTTQTINCASNIPVTCTLGVMDLTSLLQSVAATLPQVPGVPGGTTGSVQCNNANHFIACSHASDIGGTFAVSNLNNTVAVDGVRYTTLAQAFADPTCSGGLGCVIDMRGASGSAALALGSFDPGSIPVTLLLGPFTYTTSGITLRPSFHMSGTAGGGPLGLSTGTFITPTNTSVPIIKMPATSTIGIADVQLSDFRINCAPGNTNQVGINITAPQQSGLWYSGFYNIQVENCMGEGILLDGSAGGSPVGINQFLKFDTVIVIRPANAAPSIHMRGVNGQFIFTNCLFDAAAQYGGTHDNLPNVVIEDSAVGGIIAPYSIAMYQTTIQGAGVAVKLRGVQSYSCDNCHFEHDWGILNSASGVQFGSPGNSITNSAIYTSGVSVPGGSGYLITMDANSQILFQNNSQYGTPDNFYLGTLTHLTAEGLYNSSNGQPFPGGPSSLRIAEGIFGDASGFKAANVSTGTISAGTRVSVTVPWVTPFPDTGYVPLCTIADFNPAGNAQGLVAERVNAQSTSQIQVTVFNPTGSPDSGNLGCIAVHQ